MDQNNNQQSPPGKGLAIASMVLGICSLVIPYAGIVTAIVGLILGIKAKKQLSEVGAPSGMAQAGIIMSIIAIAWSILVVVLCTVCAATGALANIASGY